MQPFLADPDFLEDDAGCWIWQGFTAPDGYGRVNRGPATESPKVAHRYVYERMVGPIPAGRELHHVCGQRRCVNPAHLAVVTRSEHARLEQEARTHCRRGHEYAIHGRFHKGTNSRYCRACERDNERRRIRAAAAALRR